MTTLTLPQQLHEGVEMPKYIVAGATVLALFSALMYSFGSEVEQRAITHVVKSHYVGPEQLTQANQEIEIIRDRFLIFIILGSAFGGSLTFIGLKLMFIYGTNKPLDKMVKLSLASGFMVSVLTSLFLSPGIIHLFIKNNSPEVVGGFTYLFAVGATSLWDVVSIISNRWKVAAEKGGVSALRAEITGTQPVPPVPPLVAPSPKTETKTS